MNLLGIKIIDPTLIYWDQHQGVWDGLIIPYAKTSGPSSSTVAYKTSLLTLNVVTGKPSKVLSNPTWMNKKLKPKLKSPEP